MLGKGREILDFSFLAVHLDFPYSHMIITTSGSETSFPIWFKVSRVDRGVLVVPIDDEGRGFHRDGKAGMLGWSKLELHREAPGEAVGEEGALLLPHWKRDGQSTGDDGNLGLICREERM